MKNNPLKDILDGVDDLKTLGDKANKMAKKFLDKHKDDGANGVAIIVFGEGGSACAMSLRKSKLDDEDAIRLVREQMDSFEAKSKESEEEDEDEDDTSHDEELDPKLKVFAAMIAKGQIDKNGDPSGKFMAEAFIEMKKLTEKGMPYNTAVIKAVNKVLGSPLSKQEEKEVAKRFKEQTDED